MLWWAAYTVVLAALARADFDLPLGDYGVLSWPGPATGCSSADGIGKLEVSCALSSGRVTVALDRNTYQLTLYCEDGTYRCSELVAAQPYFEGYVNLWNATMSGLTITNCSIEEPLTCVLATVNATDTRSLKLQDTRGALLPSHVEGLKAMTRIRIHGADQNITSIPYDALAVLPNISSFTLMGGALELIEEKRPPLMQLTKLELSQGELRQLPARALTTTPDITTLMLWGNKISAIDEDAFTALTMLETLTLNNNELSSLPRRLLRDCRRLRLLHAFGNELVELPADLLAGLSRLEEVKIFRNRGNLHLESRTFANLPALKTLWLDNCGLDEIPEDLLLNSPLETLSLTGNNLTEIPPKIFTSTKLKSLNLAGNQLSELPTELLRGQDHLERLDVSSNRLARVQGGLFANLDSLKHLNLRNNNLEQLDSTSLSGLPALQELDLSLNRLRILHAATFEVLPSLQVLLASNNGLRLSALGHEYSYNVDGGGSGQGGCSSPFSSLRELRRLDLQHNRLTAVCEDWRLMLYLEKLDLAHNDVSDLTDVDLNFLSPARVDLQYNNITSIGPYLDMKTNHDKPTFLLDNNPFICDCNLYPFLSVYLQTASMKNYLQLSRATCKAPSQWYARRVLDVPPESLTCRYDLCPHDCSCYFRTSTYRLEVQCSSLPSTIPSKGMKIDLTLKNITTFSKLPFHVEHLNLSHLNLSTVPYIDANEVDLTYNRLEAAPIQLFEGNISMRLAHNLLRCDCDNRDNLQLLQKYRRNVLDYGNVTCAGGRPLAELRAQDLCLDRHAAVVSAALVLAFLVFTVTIVTTYHIYKTEIRIILRKYGLWCGREDVDDKTYDAFVSFAHQDEKFVFEKMLPALESGRRPLKLCVHTRDWCVGDWIPEQIERSVEQSRRTIVVLSQHFVKSMWGQMEFRAAHARDRAVVLVLDDTALEKCADPELRAYVSTNTYVKAGDPLVWDRLKDAVLKRNKVAAVVDKLRVGGLDTQLKQGKLVNGALETPS